MSVDEVGGLPNRGMHLPKTYFLRRVTIPIDVMGTFTYQRRWSLPVLVQRGGNGVNEPYRYRGVKDYM